MCYWTCSLSFWHIWVTGIDKSAYFLQPSIESRREKRQVYAHMAAASMSAIRMKPSSVLSFFFLLKFYSKLCNRKGINKSKRKKYAHHMSESVRIEEIESKSCLYIYKHTFCAFFCKKSAFHLHTFYSNEVN